MSKEKRSDSRKLLKVLER